MTKLFSSRAQRCGIVFATLSLWGCATAQGVAEQTQSGAPAGSATTAAVGPYLAAQFALSQRDVPTALSLYQTARAADPANPELGNRVLLLAIDEGRFDIAGSVASEMVAKDSAPSPLPVLYRIVEHMRVRDNKAAKADAEQLSDTSFFRYLLAFTRAWALYADQHDASAALAQLYANEAEKSLVQQTALHAALILDLANQPHEAENYYRAALSNGRPGLRLVQLAGNFFERTGNRGAAKELYESYAIQSGDTNSIPTVTAVSEAPDRIIENPAMGLAEGLLDLASLLNQDASPDAAMLLDRLALRLQPDFPIAQLVLGDILDQQQRHEAALTVYQGISKNSAYGWPARLREAADLDTLGRMADSEKLLRTMAAERPSQPDPVIQLANDMRAQERYADAVPLYTEALTRAGDGASPRLWTVYFDRGIANQHAGSAIAAEADLRKALALSPDQPDVLNYLGYFLTDNHERLPEAVTMIKRAVEIRPNDGYIVDSLGWAYYRQGDYAKAQTFLEQAVELRSGDAEINDHLGDAYWAAGKYDAARLQWQRSLSLLPEPQLAKMIADKLANPPTRKHASVASRHTD